MIDPVMAVFLASLVAIGAIALALWRASRRPNYELRRQSFDEQLKAQDAEFKRREAVMERRIHELETTMSTLQRLLYEKQAEIDRLNERLRTLERAAPVPVTGESEQLARGERMQPVLACVGGDRTDMFEADLAALRTVRTRTGLRFTRLFPVTRENLERKLNRDRVNGQPVKMLHFAVHSGPEGLVFADGVASGLWLSQHLVGAELVVIAGCRSDFVGDLLGAVKFVVTMREEITNTDAALFTEVFWTGIGEGLAPEAAFERALERCPPEVAEFVEMH